MKTKTARLALIAFAIFWMVSVSCNLSAGEQPAPTPTPTQPLAKNIEMAANAEIALALTSQAKAFLLKELQDEATATAAVIGQTATIQAERVHAQETQAAERKTAVVENRNLTATSEVQRVTVEAAYARDTLTASAGQTQAVIGYANGTATAMILAVANATQEAREQADWQIQHEIQVNQAEAVKMAAERQRMTNTVQAVAPWIALAAVLVAAIYATLQWTRLRVVKPDARGDAPYLVWDGKVVDLDLLPGGLVDLITKTVTPLTTPAEAAEIKHRDQFVDLQTRSLPGDLREGKANRQTLGISQSTTRVDLVPYNEMSSHIENARSKMDATYL